MKIFDSGYRSVPTASDTGIAVCAAPLACSYWSAGSYLLNILRGCFNNSSISLGVATRRTRTVAFRGLNHQMCPEASRTNGQPSAQFAESLNGSQCHFCVERRSPKAQPVFRIRRTQSPVMSGCIQYFCASQRLFRGQQIPRPFCFDMQAAPHPAGAVTQWHFFFTTLKIVFSSTPTSLVLLHDKPLSCSREKNTESFSAVRSRLGSFNFREHNIVPYHILVSAQSF